jgi:hypothetical protein
MTRSIPTVLYSSNGDPNDEEDYQDRKLSSTMKEKMMREVQESGGDPNFSKVYFNIEMYTYVCVCMFIYVYMHMKCDEEGSRE